MKDLESIIRTLYEIEPFWNICNPCQCHGFCCVGADISMSVNEWEQIRKYIHDLSANEQQIILNNISEKKSCVFRARDKCLIHSIRPENCRYTPYQALVDVNGNIKYSMTRMNPITKKCEFKRIYRVAKQDEIVAFNNYAFVKLPNYDVQTAYISLNWLVRNAIISVGNQTCNVSEWVKVRPLFE